MVNYQIMSHRLFFLLLVLVAAVPSYGQMGATDESMPLPGGYPGPPPWRFFPGSVLVPGPYAGKYEARIGGSRESENDKLRLDIGGSVDILAYNTRRTPQGLSFGADFFTWTRLRASGGFKFPVEAVDYYFGINGALKAAEGPGIISDMRLRLAHISAHLVDGDPSFTSPQQEYITYSREFLDFTLGLEGKNLLGIDRAARGLVIRPYTGLQWLFHTIPDTLGVVTPYAGLDASWQMTPALPITFRFGYEARLNTELEPIGEHQARLGVKIGDVDSRGVILEGSYYSGRSHYGQHFSSREEFFSLGFAVEF